MLRITNSRLRALKGGSEQELVLMVTRHDDEETGDKTACYSDCERPLLEQTTAFRMDKQLLRDRGHTHTHTLPRTTTGENGLDISAEAGTMQVRLFLHERAWYFGILDVH